MIVVSNNAGVGIAQAIGCQLFTPLEILNGIYPIIGSVPEGPEPIVFCGTGFGRAATGLSSRRPVFGAAEWTDRVNESPELGFELALKMGMVLPEYKIATDPQVQFDIEKMYGWEKLTSSVYIKKPSGRPITVEAFYDGSGFKNFFVKVIEDRLLYNNVGARVGASLTTTFSMPNTKLKPCFKTLAAELAIECPEYRGVVTISAVVHESTVNFRYLKFGYDPFPEMAKIALCGKQIITGAGSVPMGYASTVTLYDIRNEGLRVDPIVGKRYCIPLAVNNTDKGVFACGEEVAVCIGIGGDIRTSFDNAYELINQAQVRDICYRTDGGDYAITWWKYAQKTGVMK